MVDRAVLVVAGVNHDGRREILTWRLADVESEDTWTEVFRELKQRGVSGVQWLISDGHAGIGRGAHPIHRGGMATLLDAFYAQCDGESGP